MVGTLVTYKYRILNNVITDANVQSAIKQAGIPDLVKFVNDQSIPYTYKNVSYSINWNYPIPMSAYQIIIFDAQPLVNFAHSTGVPDDGYPSGVTNLATKSITVGRFANDDAITFGNRIWHEVNHTLGVDDTQDRFCDQQDPLVAQMFCNYVYRDTLWGWKNLGEIQYFCNYYNNCSLCASYSRGCGRCTQSGCSKCTANNTVCKAFYTMEWEKMGLFKPTAYFANAVSNGISPLSVNFVNLTAGYNNSPVTMSYHWTFGDGGTSNDMSPTHVFTGAPGDYKVTLTASNIFGQSTYSSIIHINSPVTNPNLQTNSVKFLTITDYGTMRPSPNVHITVKYGTLSYSGVSNSLGQVTMSLPCGVSLIITTVAPSGKTVNFTGQIAICNTVMLFTLPTGA